MKKKQVVGATVQVGDQTNHVHMKVYRKSGLIADSPRFVCKNNSKTGLLLSTEYEKELPKCVVYCNSVIFAEVSMLAS